MTNPDNIVRVRARNGGRASVYEANGWAQAYTSGLLEGNGVIQNTVADMNVLVGGSSSKPDVVLAENPAGYKIALDLVGQQAITITAPATNKRISAIVAYTDDLSLQSTEDTVTGSPASCGLIVVNGTAGANPSAPTDSQIRTAITADGATGSQAAYCVIATILVANNTTTITDSLITTNVAQIGSNNIDFATLMPELYETIYSGAGASSVTVSKAVANYDSLLVTVKDPGHNHTGTAVVPKGYVGSIAFAASDGGYLRFVMATISASGTTVSLSDRYVVSLSGSGSSPRVTYEASGSVILKVVGVAKAVS